MKLSDLDIFAINNLLLLYPPLKLDAVREDELRFDHKTWRFVFIRPGETNDVMYSWHQEGTHLIHQVGDYPYYAPYDE